MDEQNHSLACGRCSSIAQCRRLLKIHSYVLTSCSLTPAHQVGELHGRLEGFSDLKRLQDQIAPLT